MKSIFTLLTVLLAFTLLHAQTTADFENFGLSAGEFLNGSDGSGGFRSGNVFWVNDFNEQFSSWSGWAISAITDASTPGFTNQYSAITGSGYQGSTAYATAYAGSGGSVMQLEGEAAGGPVEGLYVTNSTYAYFSMLDGDPFAKKFGGETGDDPDFFLLTVKKYLGGELVATDSVDFYLADYRFEDNSQDYIVDEWAYLDLSSLGNADSLLFTLSSSDVGQFGMNTPAYFCIDEVTTADMPVATRELLPPSSLRAFPNPTTDAWLLDWNLPGAAHAQLFDLQGRLLLQQPLRSGQNVLSAQGLRDGIYLLRVRAEAGVRALRLVKSKR